MDVDLYRLWLRYAAPQFEFRLGLQKITFGSARILRPLMWFDRIDPRDPLQLTDGVYGLLFRYFFLDNTNLWAWGLYGNGDTKGWEALPSDSRRPEYGGRVQTPFLTGEVALSFHHRTADAEEAPGGGAGPGEGSIPEDRIGLDGKWDLGVGVWVEGVLVRKDISGVVQRYQRFVTLGMDYTFDFGNGLTVLGEHFNLASADRAFGGGEDVSISALSVNYPLGPMDSVTGILYYDWENEDWYRFVNWQRRYDNWSFYVMGFWNPEQFQIQQRVEARGTYAGKGMQVMVVFNH
jgi:hypothetical protein